MEGMEKQTRKPGACGRNDASASGKRQGETLHHGGGHGDGTGRAEQPVGRYRVGRQREVVWKPEDTCDLPRCQAAQMSVVGLDDRRRGFERIERTETSGMSLIPRMAGGRDGAWWDGARAGQGGRNGR